MATAKLSSHYIMDYLGQYIFNLIKPSNFHKIHKSSIFFFHRSQRSTRRPKTLKKIETHDQNENEKFQKEHYYKTLLPNFQGNTSKDRKTQERNLTLTKN